MGHVEAQHHNEDYHYAPTDPAYPQGVICKLNLGGADGIAMYGVMSFIVHPDCWDEQMVKCCFIVSSLWGASVVFWQSSGGGRQSQRRNGLFVRHWGTGWVRDGQREGFNTGMKHREESSHLAWKDLMKKRLAIDIWNQYTFKVKIKTWCQNIVVTSNWNSLRKH